MTDGSPEEKRHSFQHLLRAGATDVKSVQKILSYVFDCDEDKLIDRSFFDEKMAQALKEGNAHLTAAQLTRFRGLFSSHMERLGYWK